VAGASIRATAPTGPRWGEGPEDERHGSEQGKRGGPGQGVGGEEGGENAHGLVPSVAYAAMSPPLLCGWLVG
jgi:hypothetical protein